MLRLFGYSVFLRPSEIYIISCKPNNNPVIPNSGFQSLLQQDFSLINEKTQNVNVTIKYPTNSKIEECIQFYIFSINKNNEAFTYKTFQNTNLCLSLYKGNEIITNVNKTSNRCSILTGNKVKSKLFGFHKQPLEVFIDGIMDQISIIFHPGALRKFTKIPYEELMQDSDVFNTVFGRDSKPFVETLFSTNDFNGRVALLDAFLLRLLRDKYKQDSIDRNPAICRFQGR